MAMCLDKCFAAFGSSYRKMRFKFKGRVLFKLKNYTLQKTITHNVI